MIITLVHPYSHLSPSVTFQSGEQRITLEDSTFIDKLAIKNI